MAAVQVQAAYVQAVDATGKPVMAVQQTPAQAQVVAVGGGGGGAMDVNAFQNLANASSLEFKQGNVFWEAVSGGCAANSYMIRDRLSADAHGKMTPVFIASEESSCWCRACCDPNQPAYVKFYNVANGGEKPAKKCCGLTISEAKTLYNKSGGAVMTLEKPGCWKNCAQMGAVNCFVCCSICQSEAFMHTGEIESRYDPQGCGPCKVEHWSFPQGGPGFAPKNRVFSHAQVPIFGGGCTPTVNIMARNGEMESPAPPPFAIVEGPTCFGGCMDLCCNTKLYVFVHLFLLFDLTYSNALFFHSPPLFFVVFAIE